MGESPAWRAACEPAASSDRRVPRHEQSAICPVPCAGEAELPNARAARVPIRWRFGTKAAWSRAMRALGAGTSGCAPLADRAGMR